MATPSKEDWARLSSRLEAFYAATKKLQSSHDLDQHSQYAQELVTEARAAVGVVSTHPDLAASLIANTQVIGGLAAAAVAALQLQLPQFLAPAYSWLHCIANILETTIEHGKVHPGSLHATRAVGAAAAVQLTRSGLLALLPELVATVAAKLEAAAVCASAASSSSSHSAITHASSTTNAGGAGLASSSGSSTHGQRSCAAGSGPDCDEAVLHQQATILLGVLGTCCNIWPHSTGGSAAAAKERAGLAARLAASAMQHVDRALQQLPAAGAPGVYLATLTHAAITLISDILRGCEVQQAKNYVISSCADAAVHLRHATVAVCCGHLTQLLWQHGLWHSSSAGTSASTNTGTRTSTGTSSPDSSSCPSSSLDAAASSHTQLPWGSTGPIVSGATAWQLVPQYRGLLRQLLPDDQQSVQLLQAATGLLSTTLLWCSIIVCTSLPRDACVSRGLTYCKMSNWDVFITELLEAVQEDVKHLKLQGLISCVQQAYLVACVILRWLAGLQWQEVVRELVESRAAARAAFSCTTALQFVSSNLRLGTGAGMLAGQGRGRPCTMSGLDITPTCLLQQLLPLALRSTQQAVQCGQELWQHDKTSNNNTTGGCSTTVGRGSSVPHRTDARQLSSADDLINSLQAMSHCMMYMVAAVCDFNATSSGIAEGVFAVWRPYAAHFTALMETFVRSDAMGDADMRAGTMFGVQGKLTASSVSAKLHPQARVLHGDLAVQVGPLLANATAPGVAAGSAAQTQLYSLLCSSLKLAAAARKDLRSKAGCLMDVAAVADFMLHHLAAAIDSSHGQQLLSDVSAPATTAAPAAAAQASSAGYVRVPTGQRSSSNAAAAITTTTTTIAVETLLPWMRLLGCCLEHMARMLPDWLNYQGPGTHVGISSSSLPLSLLLSSSSSSSDSDLTGVSLAGFVDMGHKLARFCLAADGLLGMLQRSAGGGTSSSLAAARLADWLAAHGYDVGKMQQLVQDASARNTAQQFINSRHVLLDAASTGRGQPAGADPLNISKLAELISSAGQAVACIAIPQVCNNPRCSNMDGHNELVLVKGSNCICGGCRTAAFCGCACHKQHWPQHKAVCRALAQARARVAAGDNS